MMAGGTGVLGDWSVGVLGDWSVGGCEFEELREWGTSTRTMEEHDGG
jgi:hypothetical protein